MLINRERKKIIFEVVIILDGQKERFERIVIKTNLTKKMTILKIKKTADKKSKRFSHSYLYINLTILPNQRAFSRTIVVISKVRRP
jgi:hypothetical protein